MQAEAGGIRNEKLRSSGCKAPERTRVDLTEIASVAWDTEPSPDSKSCALQQIASLAEKYVHLKS